MPEAVIVYLTVRSNFHGLSPHNNRWQRPVRYAARR